jgi:hypothetical protein
MAPYRGDGEFAEAMAAALAGTALYRMPAAVSHEDLVAAISASAAFVGTSVDGRLTAEAYHRPDGERLAALDAFYDQVAEVASTASAARQNGQRMRSSARSPGYVAALERAHERRGQRLVTERALFADRVAALERAVETASATARAAQHQAGDDAEGRRVAEADLAALRATRTFRWAQKPRAVYEWWRLFRRNG